MKIGINMPAGDRTNYKPYKISMIIGRLLSFFKFKLNHTNLDADLSLEKIDTQGWMKYQTLKAEDIMIPRIDIVAIDSNSSLDDISRIFLETRHTRMPVYKKSLDNIIGFINIKDILPYLLKPQDNPNFIIDTVLRPLLIVSPSMKIYNLLEKMRQTRTHIALVIDEFGGADGLITIEDLVEEIIGEIEDEHDSNNEDTEFKAISDKAFEVSGRIKIRTLEEKLNLKLSEEDGEDYDTLGGLILSLVNSIPNKGDKVKHPSTGITFEILDSDPRRIKKVLIDTTY